SISPDPKTTFLAFARMKRISLRWKFSQSDSSIEDFERSVVFNPQLETTTNLPLRTSAEPRSRPPTLMGTLPRVRALANLVPRRSKKPSDIFGIPSRSGSAPAHSLLIFSARSSVRGTVIVPIQAIFLHKIAQKADPDLAGVP